MSPPRHPNVTPSILPGTSGFSQQEYSSLLRSMDGGGQHSQGHIVDFLSQQSNNDTGMPLFNQSLSSPAAHGVPVRHDNSINLNMQMAESSHMSLYQQYVQGATPDMRSGQQGVVRGRGVNSGHGGVPLPRRATSAGGATSNAGAPFCAPRTITAPTKRGRAPSSSNTQADGDTGTPQGSSNAAASEAQEDEDDPSIREGFDKANWNSKNNLIFCEICLEEIRAGNSNKGCMTNRGYKNIAEKFFLFTKQRHSLKQLRNRWTQLKGLYQFWLWLNKQSGLGRANGTVVADDDFWRQYTKGKSEWKKLRQGPPENLSQLEQMFEHVAIDGSSSCIPGEHIGGEGEDDDADEANEYDLSPMSSNMGKRANSSSTTATSPEKKTKSPMVRIMDELLENFKADSALTHKAAESMAESMKKAQRLAVECGAAEDSIEYFVAGQLFLKAENREFFCNISTKEGRLIWLKRWCKLKNMY